MSVLFNERSDGMVEVVFSNGLSLMRLEIDRTGIVAYAMEHQQTTQMIEKEDVARFGRLLLNAAEKQGVKSESIEPVAIRQLRQLRRATWDGDLLSEDVCKRLLHSGFAMTCIGNHYCLTKAGVELCWALGLLDEQESEDGKSNGVRHVGVPNV